MNENPTEVMEDIVADRNGGGTGSGESDQLSEVDELDFEELPVETDEEILAGLAESEDDIRAGRVRPAREAILEIAARYGIRVGD